ncbi:MAG: oxidoreductase [Anaerolineae bacterium]|nr:oxidoreductase [Anaerolineae bacterium]
MSETSKPKLAIYWAASCGGCDISILALHEKLLDVAANFEIVLWPCVMDFKKSDIEALADGEIAVTLFNGAIRNDENAEWAHLLRRKSQVLVAYGSCAIEGCAPGLANFSDRSQMMRYIFHDAPGTDNPDGIDPQTEVVTEHGDTLTLPAFWNTVRTLNQVVEVDYYLPGCPPEAKWAEAALDAIVAGKLPEKGAVIGLDVTVCDECPRKRSEKKISRFYRPYEIIPDPEICLLDQGLFCAGIATRAGCGALCPLVNRGCEGCYGPNEGVIDGGAKLIAALASVLDAETPEQMDVILDTLPDPAGYFYRFSLAHSVLHRAHLTGKHGTRSVAVLAEAPRLDPKLKD